MNNDTNKNAMSQAQIDDKIAEATAWWVFTHKKATLAILGAFLIWVGVVSSVPWPWGIVGTGVALIACTLFSYLPDSPTKATADF